MKISTIGKISSICLVTIILAGCSVAPQRKVINTSSGVVVHSEDYSKPQKNKTTVNGRLIKFESNYDDFSIDFDVHKI